MGKNDGARRGSYKVWKVVPAQRAAASPGVQKGIGVGNGLRSGAEDLDGASMSTVLVGLEPRGFWDVELPVQISGQSQANPNGWSPWQG